MKLFAGQIFAAELDEAVLGAIQTCFQPAQAGCIPDFLESCSEEIQVQQ